MMRGVMELEDARGKRKHQEEEEMVVKELKDMQQNIRDMLPTNLEIIVLLSKYFDFNRWIKEMKDLYEDVQELVDSGNAISKEDVAGIKQRFRLHNCSYEENKLDVKWWFLNPNWLNTWLNMENKLDEKDMDELKAMQLHIQEKLADAESYQIGRGKIMQKWLDDIRDFSRKIEAMIEYVDHLKKKNVPYRPYKLKDSVKEIKRDFSRNVIRDEPIPCLEDMKEILEDDIESMSMWIGFILTSTVSQGMTEQVKIQLENLKDDLRRKLRYIDDDDDDDDDDDEYYYLTESWKELRWRFYKIRQIQSLHPVTRLVKWNFFGFTKTQTVQTFKQVKSMGLHIKDKREDAEKWMEERRPEGGLNDDRRMFFQKSLDLLDHDEPRSTDILAISKLQVDLDMFQQQFFQTSIWVDACIQAIGEAKLSSYQRREAYYVIKEDTEIMSWQLHVILLAVKQEGWEATVGWLYELREDLDQLLKSSSNFRKFEPAVLFSAIIVWGLLKWKLQMTDKQIEPLLLLARNLSHSSRQEMDDIIKYLKNKHEWIKKRLNDAKDEEIQGETHQKWLIELRNLSYQAEDLIGLYEYQQVAKQVEPTSSLEQLSIFCQERTILREITDGKKKFEDKFDEVAKNKTDMHVTTISLSDNHLYTHEPTGYLPSDSTKFVGREEKMKKLKEALVSVHGGEGTSIEVIAVVGMGGVGKTTLCQHIYNDPDITSNFHKNRWVHVGGSFDLLRVANDILTSLSDGNGKTYKQFSQLQDKINECVRGKKLLLVLDDVWTEVITDWEKIRTLFNDAGNGSKILISTRHESVAQSADATQFIRLDKLSNEDGWSLFKMHAFREHPPPEDLVGVGEAILAKCCGLPLAIKVVGSLLRRKGDDVNNWKSLLNSNWCNFSMHEGDKENKEILGPLYLSYHHLPRRLKACFRFLSLFRKGENIQFDHLFGLWLAHDLISDDNENISMRQRAYYWIKELASRSIVDIIHNYKGSDDIEIKVHDLINDIAHFVSGNEFCFLDGTMKGSKISLDGVRHLHMRWQEDIDNNLLDTGSDLLRTIIVEDGIYNCHQLIGCARNMRLLNCSSSLLPENLSFARNLRVLKSDSYIWGSHRLMLPTIYMLHNLRYVHISLSNIVNVSCRIGNLINLQHLDLSYNQNMLKMPESVSRLTALQYLNLEGCGSLQELPSGISTLTNLRALYVSKTEIQYMPCGLSRLTKLTRLPYFPLGLQEEHASLKSLKAFQQLEGRLHVNVYAGCVKEEHAQEIEMSDSRQLNHLSIYFYNYREDQSSKLHEQILQKLKPNVKITNLEIHLYNGVKLPSWMGSRSFDKLVNIKLSSLYRCTSLSPLHMLPSLEMLKVSWTYSLTDLLEVALEEENGGSSNTGSIEHPAKPEPKLYFPKLVYLKLFSCGIECLRLYDGWFPALKSLYIEYCYWLKDIHFSDPTSALEQSQNEGTSSLTELDIQHCRKLCFGRDALLPQSLKRLRVHESDEVKRWCESNRASKLSHIPYIHLS